MKTKTLDLMSMNRDAVITEIEAMSPAERKEVSADWLAQLHASAPEDPWVHGFSVVNRETGRAIGRCGFKGPPTADGVVEIAYGIDPDHRGLGYATEAAGALVSHAFGDARVRVARAHTLPEANASTRVLTKCGFRWIGEIIDPEDGLVWRWERNKEAGNP